MERFIPCPACQEPCLVKPTKSDGLFFDCHGCLIRVFVNGPAGIRKIKSRWEKKRDAAAV